MEEKRMSGDKSRQALCRLVMPKELAEMSRRVDRLEANRRAVGISDEVWGEMQERAKATLSCSNIESLERQVRQWQFGYWELACEHGDYLGWLLHSRAGGEDTTLGE